MVKKINNTNEKKEILVYHNDFNTIKVGSFTKNRLNFFIGICYKAMGQGTNRLVLSFDEIAKVCNFKRKITTKEFVNELKKMNKELIEKNLEFERKLENGEYETIQLSLFPTFITNPVTKTLTIEVNEIFKMLLNTFNKDFTELDLKKFVNLKSKYSQLLYKELMQYKYSGYRVLKIDDFIEKLNIPSSYWDIKNGEKAYKITALSLRILNKIQDELKDILENFSYKYIVMEKKGEVKRGRKKYTHIEFTFKPIRESIQNQDKEIEVAEIIEKNNVNNAINVNNTIDEISKSLFENATEIKNNDTLSKEERKEKLLKMLKENLELLEKETEEIEETNENTDTITNKINEFSNYWQLTNKHREILLSLTNKFTGEEIEKELERINLETEKRAEIDRLGYVKACVNNAEKEIIKRLAKAEKKAKAVADVEAEVEVVEVKADNIFNSFLGKYKK
jgi:putative replication protein rep